MQKEKSTIGRWLTTIIATLLLLCGNLSCDQPLEAKDRHDAKRTLIVYMMANNSLYSISFDNIMAMLQTADLSCLNDSRLLLVYKTYSGGPRLLEVIPNDGFHKIDVVPSYWEEPDLKADTLCLKAYDNIQNALEATAMRQILRDARQFAPADDYALVLWSHSTGWLPANTKSSELESTGPATRYFGLDGKNSMEISELRKALQDFDWEYILMDACFGCSIEALYDLRDLCHYWVGSPCEVLDDGFPYKSILPYLFEESTLDGLMKTCQSFMSTYRNNNVYPSGCVSLIDMTQLDSLAVTVRDIVSSSDHSPIDFSTIQYYDNCRPAIFYDMVGYVDQLASNGQQRMLFTNQFKRSVLFAEHTKHIYSMFSGSRTWIDISLPACGVTSYIPRSVRTDYDRAYYQTEWAEFTGMNRL